MTVRRGEGDPQRFWLTMLEAIQAAMDPRYVVGSRTPTPAFDGSGTVNRVVTQLAAVDEPLVIVVNDLHELESVEALDQFEDLLTKLPSSVHVSVLATQAGIRIWDFIAFGSRDSSASFAPPTCGSARRETRALLKASGVELDARAVAVLQERTEG